MFIRAQKTKTHQRFRQRLVRSAMRSHSMQPLHAQDYKQSIRCIILAANDIVDDSDNGDVTVDVGFEGDIDELD